MEVHVEQRRSITDIPVTSSAAHRVNNGTRRVERVGGVKGKKKKKVEKAKKKRNGDSDKKVISLRRTRSSARG